MTGAMINKPFDTIIPYEKSKVIKYKNNNYLVISKKLISLIILDLQVATLKKTNNSQKRWFN